MTDELCPSKDLACGKSAVFLWYIPTLAVFVGLAWTRTLPWLWVPAFLVMGVACVMNAARCGRLHCYVTGPVYLLAAVYVALSELHLVPMRQGIFLLLVFGITMLACLAELPLTRYVRRGSLGRPAAGAK